MFSSISWFNILVLLIIGLIVIGPERLPGMIKDIRAVALAFRNLVNDARRQLDEDFGPEFKEFQKPLSQINEYRRMGPRGLVTKALFDGDDAFFNDLENTGRQLADSVNSVTNPAGHTSAERPSSQAPLPDSQPQGTGSASNAAGSRTAVGQGAPSGASGRTTNQQSQQLAAGESSASSRAAGVWDDVL
ncbi:Sec-independent protein translocase subunit TatB [Corynebacterium urealyticum]|uniref:Sec-independent protein translocase protein TatB n=1 Tax=Corynebacterium urealyticum (strain ATCC 43042 / DSM 7109) TaxID=504474 RepID=B1VFU4_CORU7|nr:Sec-independent protein translocase subunit TatB [Corynebacterium urealyticum]QQC41885.1 Sec-independent protein translocase subunit TatB [Corynebacterium urealyticum]TYR15756.1 Sec-independent protein translocase subunit TatB [Corynebacterium urealyticum]TYR18245.1 Sec-independent protein translocase subunit TatB [Corynebacterium urealyticum]TYT21427.1 Sec-independent protein translocase subunit TatB [Corynebacterium urealyticum]CAQ04633.1 Sec-independent protein translocase protein [Coryn